MWRDVGSGLNVLFPDNLVGLSFTGDLDLTLGTTGLGPRPSFSLMAGDKIDVNDANMINFVFLSFSAIMETFENFKFYIVAKFRHNADFKSN